VAALGLLAILAVISVVLFLGNRDGCMSGSDGGSCPALADVNGVRYEISAASQVVDAETALQPAGVVERTNYAPYFLDETVYSLHGVSSRAVLVARAKDPGSAVVSGDFLLLLGPDRGTAWPNLCHFLTREAQRVLAECGGVEPR
jgi:hypothetical protein